MRSVLLLAVVAVAFDAPPETTRYLRPAGDGFATECDFVLKAGVVESTTQRGKTKLVVTARYDDKDRLTTAEVVLHAGDEKKAARVAVRDGKATVERDGKPAQTFEVPPGVIVTSAPDWTDTFLLCRKYDRAKGGKQEFAGLWVHPVEDAQRLTFTAERHDATAIDFDGKRVTLDRYTLRIRGNSAYAAWADADGRLVKLVPLPYKAGATNWLVREGYQKSAGGLTPP